MIINIPDYLVGIIFGLMGICAMLSWMAIISDTLASLKYKRGNNTFQTKKWTYTRTRREENK